MSVSLQEMLSIPKEELHKYSRVKVQILPDLESLYQHFARSIADEIKANNEAGKSTKLILPVGPIGQYPILVKICNKEHISWKNTYTFNMDEYLDWQGRSLPVDHPMSFEGYMRRNVFNHLDSEIRIPEDHIWFPDPLNLDEINRKISEVGGIDTCYGGIGYHGHIAFNEPPISRWYKISPREFKNSLTRTVHLAPETIVMNSIRATGGNSAALPPMAVTLGMKDILSARRIRLYCQGGNWQKTIFRIALMGEVSVDYPVTFVQEHSDCVIHADANTAEAPLVNIAV